MIQPNLSNPAKLNLGLYFMAIAVLIIFALTAGDTEVDIHLHDSYFVVPKSYLFKAPALVLIAITLLYIFTKGITRITSLMFIHTLGTLGMLAWILHTFYYPPSATAANSDEIRAIIHRSNLVQVVVRLLLWWQLLLPLNWWLSSVRK